MKKWAREKVYHSGDLYFSALCNGIRTSTKTIDLEIYIFSRDLLGYRIIQMLKEAVDRGVRVRLLVDGIGSPDWDQNFIRRTAAGGVAVKIYHPPPWGMSLGSSFRLRELIRSVWRLNRRNHRKFVIIDEKVVFAGGMNISDVYLRDLKKEKAWRDTAVQVEGEEVRYLTEAFERVWSKEPRRKGVRSLRVHRSEQLIRLNDTFDKRRNNHKELIHRILKSRKRVWITTPYLVPDLSLMRAVRYAASSGVDVRIIVPGKSDIPFMSLANSAFYSVLIEYGVRVFEYTPTILHAKVLLIDHWVLVGSSNRNQRSLVHDLEIDVVLGRNDSINSIKNQFEKDLASSEEITPGRLKQRPWLRKFFSKLVLFFRYWI